MVKFRHPLPRIALVRDRAAMLREECAGKRVVDVGCVSSGLLEEHVGNGTLLHQQLAAAASAILGVDVDVRGVERLKALGFANVIAADLCESSKSVIGAVERLMKGCDVIVCGEVLEHVPNAGALLRGVAEVAGRFGAYALVTVPNAFSIRGMLAVLAGTEIVHSDHKYYFSWQTLKSLFDHCGLEIIQTHFYAGAPVSASRATRLLKATLNRTLVALRPQLAEGIIVKVRVARHS
jgi:2-polyprenyl-3-methyl-5-hydroxy-6-metoxy-1,4-benzoquinol methylase